MAQFQVEGAALELLLPGSTALMTELGRGVWAAATGVEIPAGAGLSGQVLATR